MPLRDPIAEYGRWVLRTASRSFSLAARLLDRRTRERGCLLYAWCRYCDDAIDGQNAGGPQQSLLPEIAADRLTRLRDWTRRASADETRPDDPLAFHGLSRIVRDCGIPVDLPMALLDGMAHDVAGARFPTIDDLVRYCGLVGGTVARMMAHAIGATDPGPLERAERLGIATQLTNIVRDVVDDAAAGRRYFPVDWLRAEGVPPTEISRPEHRAGLARVAARLLDQAEEFYAAVDGGLPEFPFRAAWATVATRWIYGDIGRVIRRRGARAWDRRAYVSGPAKIWSIARALTVVVGGRWRRGD